MEEATEIAKVAWRVFADARSAAFHHKNSELQPAQAYRFQYPGWQFLDGIIKWIAAFRQEPDSEAAYQPSLIADERFKIIVKFSMTTHFVPLKLIKITHFSQGEDAGVWRSRIPDYYICLATSNRLTRFLTQRTSSQLLLGDFRDLKIRFEQATWTRGGNGRRKTRQLEILKTQDIEVMHPFLLGI